jgi:hypothetical protein
LQFLIVTRKFAAEMNPVPLDTLTLPTFSKLLQTTFRVGISANEIIEFKLVQATPGPTFARDDAHAHQYESFSLLFHVRQTRPLPQGTYPFEHPQIGKFDLFIVPVAAENGVIHYQAVFNRLVKPG